MIIKKLKIKGEIQCKTLETLQEYTHTHTHTLCLLEDKSLKSLGLVCVVEKLYIKYREMKVEFFTSGDAIWIGGKDQQRVTAQYKYVPNWEEFNLF